MIDTITFTLPLKHKPVGLKASYSQDIGGRNIWFKPIRLTGIASPGAPSIQVHSSWNGNFLSIHGSPAAYLQGTNAFGSSDLQQLVEAVVESVTSQLEIHPSKAELKVLKRGEVQLSRVDIARYALLPSRESVRATLHALKLHAACTSKNAKFFADQAVYFGSEKAAKLVKFYDKYEELRSNKRFKLSPHREEILEATKEMIRFELTLRSTELRRLNLGCVRDWSIEKQNELVSQSFQKLNLEALKFWHVPVCAGEDEQVTTRIKMAEWLYRLGFPLVTKLSPKHFRSLKKSLHQCRGIALDAPVEVAKRIRRTGLAEVITPHNFRVRNPPPWLIDGDCLFPQKNIVVARSRA